MGRYGYEPRFDRMVRTSWIDMGRIHGARVLVAGAGALGNEILKDLVLAGFRDITVSDPDLVEESNLSRCVLFSEKDIGRNKADVAAESSGRLDTMCRITAAQCKIQDIDLSCYDVYLGGLDSVSARLHLNSCARLYGIPYVDGGTDGFRGRVQAVLRSGPCLECAMNRTHINELHRTFSCDPSKTGSVKDPVVLSSGITTTAVIAASCVREAIKIVCGKEESCIGGIGYYDGMSGTMEVLDLQIKPGCPNHGGEGCHST